MRQSGQMTTDSFARLRYATEILRYALDDNKTLCENSEIKICGHPLHQRHLCAIKHQPTKN